MKKLCIHLSVIIACVMLALTMVGCSKKDGEIEGDGGYNPVTTNISNKVIPAEGGAINVAWSRGTVIYDDAYTNSWKFGQDLTPHTSKSEGPWEKANVTIEKDIMTGEWFVVVPVGSKEDGKYPGVRVFVSPNTTGKKRCLKLFDTDPYQYAAYIYQDCD
jgi:hypothetical protein